MILARLVHIKGQNVLFSESQRAIFALNDSAAEIWRLLQEGTPAYATSGSYVDPLDVNGHVKAALKDWERLGLIRPRISSIDLSPHAHVNQVLAVAGRRIRILYPAAHAFPANTVFKHLEAQEETADTLLQLVEHGDRLHLLRNGDWLSSCAPDEIATALKGELLSDVLRHCPYELALHAAALIKGERIVLLCGNPGAGKTTLTLALAQVGFGFAADDVTLLNSDGLGVGLPFAPAVKPGAWSLLAKHVPGLDIAPIFRRPDGKRVRYVVPTSITVSSAPRPIGAVILLRRDHNARPSLDPVDPVAALRGLLSGAFAPGGELSAAAFDVLAGVIGSAPVYSLTYSGLDDAVDLIGRACP